MPLIKSLPLEPDEREAFVRAAKEAFEEACLQMDWRDAVKARENWVAATFVDQVLFFHLSLPIGRDIAFNSIGRLVFRHVIEDLLFPEHAELH